jgi:hypothetical protein
LAYFTFQVSAAVHDDDDGENDVFVKPEGPAPRRKKSTSM